MSKPPITEADLQAYVDAALPEARYGEVEDYLAAHPEEAERVHAYQAQKQALRALFNPILDEPLPENLRALASPPPIAGVDRPPRPFLARWSLERIAAGVVIAVFSSVAGWMAHGQYQPAESMARAPLLPRQAAVAHVVFSPDVRRPVEISAEHEDQLVAWLSKRLGTPVHPPKLGALGYELIGGRLLPGNSGPVAQFMYHDATGQRLTLYVSTENTANHDTAFRFAQEGPVNVFYWIDGKFGYALSAGIDKGELARVASAVYDQIEHK
ncbi:membrane protein [Sulfuricella sp. T08]|uniref:anti-sigma factor family protein n=1 Tax=Sulfuricella sp. T08 TaxID=1632857 RepID=UPI0006179F60|nr:anti-sigma factor [Sulfuricella sp. T08]GAO37064.1 membrane protein [Sulfuricella sp. T08]